MTWIAISARPYQKNQPMANTAAAAAAGSGLTSGAAPSTPSTTTPRYSAVIAMGSHTSGTAH